MDSASKPIQWKILAVITSIALVIGLCPGLSQTALASETATASQQTTAAVEQGGASADKAASSSDSTSGASATEQNGATGNVEVQEGTIEMPVVNDVASQSATAEGAVALADDDQTSSNTVTGGSEIKAGGTYKLAADASGVIKISTTEAVTVEGNGLSVTWNSETGQAELTGTSNNIAFDASATAGVNLTVKDVYLSNTSDTRNTFNFTGKGNKLSFEGTNVIDYNIGYTSSNDALVHVAVGTELNILGSGTAYIYNCTQGAGIGGNTGEYNGTIVFGDAKTKTGPTIFEKGTRQGAVIGAGARASSSTDVPGSVTFNGGVYNLISNSRGAVIGGSAGSDGASSGTTVYFNGGSVNINVDFSGAAVGGGGYDSGNDASGGKAIFTGGSVRIYVDKNAAGNTTGWKGNTYTEGINDAAMTAERLNGDGENAKEVARCAVDTSALPAADTYTAYVDGSSTAFYSGPLHGYAFIQEGLDKGDQLGITDTPTNWIKSTDSNLYFYLTKENHTITVNGVRFDATYDAATGTFAVEQYTNVKTGVTGNGTVSVSPLGEVKVGETVKVTATPAEGSYLSQIRYAVKAEGSEDYSTYTAVKASDGTYSFTMPEGEVMVYADFVSKVWDGTIDVSWYDLSATEYHLQYAAQFAGAAAINNGIFTTYPTKTVAASGSTASHEQPDYDAYLKGIGAVYDEDYNISGSNLYGEFTSTYTVVNTQVSVSTESEVTKTTRVVGNAGEIVANTSVGSHGSNNQVTTSAYWYGAEDYNGKTIYIDADLDFGATKTDGAWDVTSPLFFGLGGQYAMLPQNGYSVLGASFNGTLDGLGHSFNNVYAERYSKGGNFGDAQSLGIVGRLGNHDGDSADMAAVNPTVRQIVLESGYVSCRRSSGAIVGKIGQTTASKKNDGSTGGIIEYCINKADVYGTDKKGIGGICGAGWNKGVIRYCANFGDVSGNYNTAGIVGSCEVPVIGCYNVGDIQSKQATYAEAIGSYNSSGCSWVDCFYLVGSDHNTKSPGVYRGTSTNVHSFGTNDGKTGDYSTLEAWMVNGGTSQDDLGAKIWKTDTTGINAKDGVNYPVLYFQNGSASEDGYSIYALQSSDHGTVSVDKTKAQYGDTVTISSVANPGYILDHYVVNGAETTSNTFTVTESAMVTAVFRELNHATFTIEDTTDKDYQIAVTKTGVVYDDQAKDYKAVENYPVASGDTVYETDVLTYAASIKEGKTPEDTSTEYTGTFTYKTYGPDDKTLGSAGTYTVKSTDTQINATVNRATVEKKSWITLADTSWYDASKTEFTISTPAQLAGVAKLVNEFTVDADGNVTAGANFEGKTVKLANDISLKNTDGTDGVRQWCPISNSTTTVTDASKVFRGTFDGCGHMVSDMEMHDSISGSLSGYRGLFGNAAYATIQNVSVSGSITASNYNGGIAGRATYSTIKNCTSSVTIEASTAAGVVGGVVGYAVSTNISDCVNSGDLSAYLNYAGMGGIVGSTARFTTTDTDRYTVSNCVNTGNITLSDSVANNGCYVGGIASGYAYSVDSYYDYTGCANYGNINVASSRTSASVYVGGILGGMTNPVAMTECFNAGSVSSSLDNANLGGLVGNMSKGGTITNCYNKGKVEATSTSESASAVAGGFVGSCTGNAVGTITNCYNSGENVAPVATNHGAIAPNAFKTPNVVNCYYLDTTGTTGGTKTDDTFTGATSLASADLKAAAEKLGDKFATDTEGGYPVLSGNNKVVVTFDSDGGTLVAPVTVTVGGTVAKPADPTRDGYQFEGWFMGTDEEAQAEFDFATPIVQNTTLVAGWSRLVTVSFDLGYEGATPIDPMSVVEGSSLSQLPTPTRGGYTFEGWYAGDTKVDTATTFSADTTLTAKWEAVSSQVVYRMYNPITSEHLFTTDASEYDSLVAHDWQKEGEAWSSPTTGKGVYRLYNAALGAMGKMSHHYTTDKAEADKLEAENGWVYDNGGQPIFYSAEDESGAFEGAAPVYRLYNGGLSAHHYTMDKSEADGLVKDNGWTAEGEGGIGFYAMAIKGESVK